MNWTLSFLPEAEKDLSALDGSRRLLALKAIRKVCSNPLPVNEGGYGKPLGHVNKRNLTGFLKIKLRDAGIRIVYKLVRTETRMLVVVIGLRADDEAYEIAERRIKKYGL